jgi:hypothetical protein
MRTLSIPEAQKALEAEGVDTKTISAVIDYFLSCPETWRRFEMYALQAAKKDIRVGAKCIWEKVRYEVEVEDEQPFAANNNYPAYYARIFETKWPEHKGFFERRAIKGLTSVKA